jgi:hypothetical protein
MSRVPRPTQWGEGGPERAKRVEGPGEGRIAIALLAGALLLASCRTGLPDDGEPIAALTAPTAEAALADLRARRAALHEVRAMMRVRVTNGDQIDSFRAQLAVNGEHMELTGYTPIGTTAVEVVADGNRVAYRNSIDGTEWQGSAADLSKSIGFFVPQLPPSEMALLILGYPTVDRVEATPTGLARATVGDVVVTYDPPVHPPQRVTIVRGAQRVEIVIAEMTTE